ncbi:TIGR03915 family putative DNA repair protein [Mucilaginibacter myungsuensis]|uniref:TIGR03915 family putative DNA repair protein n=1 Tax=Mucilaginibacter myungsuensis TaxID=649104 RepID=A0A929PUZ9_9SPHI|nr:TIGR03915 family putative DNA repair protein [Mucilaginibacter myungsuensis]MBE9660471.1 TIGR03915 family putative DNA repair protein [Mucilaginibacter myungsuensis]MDN3600513.1 TIGR03915 family putative DNA repair protein [Mucilaginibacter myungsuensis]
MTTLIYDGSFEGLLTAAFEVYERRLLYVDLKKGERRTDALFDEVIQVITDNARAERVLAGLKQKLSRMGLQRLYAAHLAEFENEDNMLLGYIRYVFDAGQNIEEDYGNKYVMRVSELVRKVRREKHRMEAFIRFQKLKDETFYAAIEPDFNVLPLIIRHFKNRYADQQWIIYDTRRKYGVHYNLHHTEYISLDFSDVTPTKVVSAYDEGEELYQVLWKNYFKSVNIPARKNNKLHLMHVPKRYWRHLTEKI